MNLIHTTALSDAQKKEAILLGNACKEAEPLNLSVPTEDDLDYVLAVSDGPKPSLMGLGFLLFVERPGEEDVVCEFTAFVHPKHRRKGVFTAMLNQALDLLEVYEKNHHCTAEFCILTDEQTPSAKKTLAAIEAEYWYSEHKMVRKCRESDARYEPRVRIIQAEENLYTASLEDEVIGTCAVLPAGSETYLYAFQVKEEFRGQGLGEDFLLCMLAIMAQIGDSLSMQVS